MWRITISLSASFLWGDAVVFSEGQLMTVDVELSLQGLLKKFDEMTTKNMHNGYTFKRFLADAIKEALEIQVMSRLLNENYEGLGLDEQMGQYPDKKKLYGVFNNYYSDETDDSYKVRMQWKETRYARFMLLSFRTPVWLDMIKQRISISKLNTQEREFILKYQ